MDTNDEPAPFTSNHPRCREVAARLADAAARMDAMGIPRLLAGRVAWKRVTPAPAYVIPFRRPQS